MEEKSDFLQQVCNTCNWKDIPNDSLLINETSS